MHVGSVKLLNQGVTPDRDSDRLSESNLRKLFVVVTEIFNNPRGIHHQIRLKSCCRSSVTTLVCLNRS